MTPNDVAVIGPRTGAGVRELAILLSTAVQIESELIRAVRLELAPRHDVSAEADLWFSDLVARGADSIRLRFDVLPELRKALADRLLADPHDLAWQLPGILARVHTDQSAALRLEEQLNWLAIQVAIGHAPAVHINEALQPALRAVIYERRRGISDWFASAWHRLPPEVQKTTAAWQLLQMAADRAEAPAQETDVRLDISDVYPLRDLLADVWVPVRHDGRSIVFNEPPRDGSRVLPVPDTRPRVVQVRWQAETGARHQTVRFNADQPQSLAVGSGAALVVTGRGQVFEVDLGRTPPIGGIDTSHHSYLDGLSADTATRLDTVNRRGLAALQGYLASRKAVAVLGMGASAPLYPKWDRLLSDLIDAAASLGLAQSAADICRALVKSRPSSVVEAVRRRLGTPQYHAALREVFRVRRDPDTGRTWTAIHEIVCRCTFEAVVTTSFDPGILDARMKVRPHASRTGFASYTSESALERWRTGEVFADPDELPVLFAHGHYHHPDAMLLSTAEYWRAYAGKLSAVFIRLLDTAHLVWVGFSFGDQRISTVLNEVAEKTGNRIQPGNSPRHIAIMGWDPDNDEDPTVLQELAEIEYGADLVLFPAPQGDQDGLAKLLAELTDPRYPPVALEPAPRERSGGPATVPVHWAHGAEPGRLFVGRVEELARLDRWAGDGEVRLIGVTAWGGAGKTALVTHWIDEAVGALRRPGVRGVFGWSFYSDPSAEDWATTLVEWAADTLGVRLGAQTTMAVTVVELLRAIPIMLVLDGLEVVQEGPSTDAYGRLLDGLLREVLTAACRRTHRSLVILTSRFPFVDLAAFEGTSARMLDVPPFTLAEGSEVLAAAGVVGVDDSQQRALVAQVDGHALAVSAMAAMLADHPDPATAADLLANLGGAGKTGAKWTRVLRFYADRLAEPDRYLVAAVALFSRPVRIAQILAVAEHPVFASHLAGIDADRIAAAVAGPLAGLLTWHSDRTVSAHPLIRQTFGPLAYGAAEIAVQQSLTDAPTGAVVNRDQALRVVEAIELLLEADQWDAAHDLYRVNSRDGDVWKNLPAARLGQRAAAAFVAPSRRDACATRLGADASWNYMNDVGLYATNAGDIGMARDYLNAVIQHGRTVSDSRLSTWLQNWTDCLLRIGNTRTATQTAQEVHAVVTRRHGLMQLRYSLAYLAWAADLAGNTDTAEAHFLAADRIEHAVDKDRHLFSVSGVQWGLFLGRTGRIGPAGRLTEANLRICQANLWNEDVARCRLVLARLRLNTDETAAAQELLQAAVATLREGDYLVELADALAVSAECLRRTGELTAAEDSAAEALNIAQPRGLVPSQAAALAVSARIAADRYTSARDVRHLQLGRDAADEAYRLSTGDNHLAWSELDAMQAHAMLDRIGGTDGDWGPRAADLLRQLVPDGLDPDPLATIESETIRR